MGDNSGILWTDATWNPIIGCSKVSPGCAHCYAESVHRKRMDGLYGYPEFRPWTPGNASHNVTLMPDRLDQPLRWTKPRMVFVNSMSDLFHEQIPESFIVEVFARMALAPQHTFQVLTKRPERMAAILNSDFRFWLDVRRRVMQLGGNDAWNTDVVHAQVDNMYLRNAWLGVSVENRRFIKRADVLRRTPAAVRFVSAEPLLGPLVAKPSGKTKVNAGEHRWNVVAVDDLGIDLTAIDWLIVGGESGPEHRPMVVEWVRGLRDAAQAAGTAFFYKQLGGITPKAGGRELDGRTWDEMPGR